MQQFNMSLSEFIQVAKERSEQEGPIKEMIHSFEEILKEEENKGEKVIEASRQSIDCENIEISQSDKEKEDLEKIFQTIQQATKLLSKMQASKEDPGLIESVYNLYITDQRMVSIAFVYKSNRLTLEICFYEDVSLEQILKEELKAETRENKNIITIKSKYWEKMKYLELPVAKQWVEKNIKKLEIDAKEAISLCEAIQRGKLKQKRYAWVDISQNIETLFSVEKDENTYYCIYPSSIFHKQVVVFVNDFESFFSNLEKNVKNKI